MGVDGRDGRLLAQGRVHSVRERQPSPAIVNSEVALGARSFDRAPDLGTLKTEIEKKAKGSTATVMGGWEQQCPINCLCYFSARGVVTADVAKFRDCRCALYAFPIEPY